MPGLMTAQGSEVSYNGITFDENARTRLTGTIVRDDANRMVKYVQWELEVIGYVNGLEQGDSAGTDSTLDVWRSSLTEPGGQLRYSNKGFGTFVINSGRVRDVKWGPVPTLFSFVPVGAKQTVLVHWKVTTCIPECHSAVFQRALLMACYDVSWDIDEDGLQSVTIEGAIEIPVTFTTAGGGTVIDHADNYYHLAYPEVVRGFQRTTRKRKLSKDRTRLEFSYTDKQLPAPLPRFVTKADVTHRVRSSYGPPLGFNVWLNTISGTIKVDPSAYKGRAWEAFWLVFSSRMRQQLNWAATRPEAQVRAFVRNVPTTSLVRGSLLITDLEFEESVFGLENRFSISWKEFGVPLDKILSASGLWTPLWATVNHDVWKTSLRNTVNNPRGLAQLGFDASKDTLIDLCNTSNSSVVQGEQPSVDVRQRNATGNASYGPAAYNFQGVAPKSGGGAKTWYNPAFTWIGYDSKILWDEDDHIVRHKPLAGTVTLPTGLIDQAILANMIRNNPGNVNLGLRGTVRDAIQRISAPSISMRMIGSAARLQYPIEPPRLLTFVGNTVAQGSQRVVSGPIGAIGNVPIHGCAWDIEYIIQDHQGDLPIPANPALQTNSSTNADAPINFLQGMVAP